MNRSAVFKNNFLYGLVDPTLEAREDFEGLVCAFREAQNVDTTASGALCARAGDDVLCDVAADLGVKGPFLLAEFSLTNKLCYQIIFFDHGFAVWGKNGWIRNASGNVLKVNTSYDAEDFFSENGGRNFRFTQSASVLYAACEKYPLAKITRVSETEWSFSEVQLKQGPWMSENTNKSAYISASGTTGTVTLKSTFKEPSCTISINPYTLAENETVLSVVWTREGAEIARSAPAGWKAVDTRGAVDILLSAQPDLTAEGDAFSQLLRAKENPDNWAGKKIALTVTIKKRVPGEDGAEEITYSYLTAEQTFTSVSAAVPIFTADMAGREIFLKYVDENMRAWSMSEEKAVAVGEIFKSGENYYKSLSSGSKTGFTKPVHTEGVVSDGQLMFQYLHSGYGVARILSVESATSATALVESYLPDGIVTNRWRLGLLDGLTYPSAVGFWKGRMTLLYNSAEGPKVLMSQPEDYENFADYVFGLLTAESAINLTINADLSQQSWMLAKDELYIGTQGGVVRVYTPLSSALSHSNVSYEKITSDGAADVAPVALGGYILYATLDRKNLILAVYDDNSASFQTVKLSKLNARALAAGIADMTYVGYPFNALFLRMKDGGLYRFSIDLSENARGLFQDTQILPADDISQGFDAHGEKKEFYSLNGGYLLRRGKSDLYAQTPRPWHAYAWPLAYGLSPDGKKITAVGPLVKTAPQRIFVNGEDRGYIASWIDETRADLSALDIPQDAVVEVRLDMKAQAVLVPFYGAELQAYNGGQITEVSFELFRTEDFRFGEDPEKLQQLSLLKRFLPDGTRVSGELRADWPGTAHLRTLAPGDRVLTNAPEIRIESVPDKFFCIAGIKILNFGGEGI